MGRKPKKLPPVRRGHRWKAAGMTMERLRELRNRREHGIPTRLLAAEVGVSHNLLATWWQRYLRFAPLHPHQQGPIVWGYAELVGLRKRRQAGETTASLADEIGCSVAALHSVWSTYGLTKDMPL